MKNTEKSPAAVREMTTEQNVTLVLEYYLQEYEHEEDPVRYGIKVNKSLSAGAVIESAESLALSCDRDEVLEILTYLANGTVPPCTLGEMIDEWHSVAAAKKLAKPVMPPTEHTYHREAQV